jgi:hypothetical protein
MPKARNTPKPPLILTAKNFYDQPRTVAEAAEYYRLSERYIRSEIALDRLIAWKPSYHALRLLPQELLKWEELRFNPLKPRKRKEKAQEVTNK